jgi:hypothetical protein
MIRKYIIVADDSIKGFDEGIAKLEREWGAEEIESCEDCISRAEALKHSHIEYDDDDIGHRVVYAEDIEALPSVTPTIPEDEDNFDIGYNCGYADAMCDIGGED